MANFEYVNDSSNEGDTPPGVGLLSEGFVNGNQAAMRFRKSEAWVRTVDVRVWVVSDRLNRASSSVRLAEILHNSSESWSEVVRDDEDGENAVGAASRKVASRSGCKLV